MLNSLHGSTWSGGADIHKKRLFKSFLCFMFFFILVYIEVNQVDCRTRSHPYKYDTSSPNFSGKESKSLYWPSTL